MLRQCLQIKNSSTTRSFTSFSGLPPVFISIRRHHSILPKSVIKHSLRSPIRFRLLQHLNCQISTRSSITTIPTKYFRALLESNLRLNSQSRQATTVSVDHDLKDNSVSDTSSQDYPPRSCPEVVHQQPKSNRLVPTKHKPNM